MARVLVPEVDLEPIKATLTTAIAGTHNDLTLTAKKGGGWGNDIQIAYVEPGASTPAISVVVTGLLITVNLETDGSNNALSTAAEVLAALLDSNDAMRLIDAELAPSNNGTGVVDAFAATNLAGGNYKTAQPALTGGDATNGHYIGENEGDTVIEVVNAGGTPRTVTLHYAADPTNATERVPETIDVGANATVLIPPMRKDLFNQNDAGDVYLDVSHADLDLRAYKAAAWIATGPVVRG